MAGIDGIIHNRDAGEAADAGVSCNRTVLVDEGGTCVKVVEMQAPQPKEEEVLVQVQLRPVHWLDLVGMRSGFAGQVTAPFTPGLEGMGHIVQLGASVSGLCKGQRVIGTPWPTLQGQGSWQQFVCLHREDVVPVPGSMSDFTAAQAWINPTTSYGLLRELDVPKGEWLLQTAADRVAGCEVCSLAKYLGVKTINVMRGDAGLMRLVMPECLAAFIDGTKEDVVKRVMDLTGGKGAWAAIDAEGGKQAAQTLRALRPQGRCLCPNALADSPVQIDPNDMLWGNKQLNGFTCVQWTASHCKPAVVCEVLDLIKERVLLPGSCAPARVMTYPLEQAQQAIEKVQACCPGVQVFLSG